MSSRSAPFDAPAPAADFDALLIAIDDLGKRLQHDRDYYRELLEILLRSGQFAAIRVWTIRDGLPALKAIAPDAPAPAAPPEPLCERALRNQAIDLSDPASNGSSHSIRQAAGFRILDDLGILLDVTLSPSAAQERTRRLLEAVAELVGHAETRLHLLASRQQAAALAATDQIVRDLNQPNSLEETALLIADSFRRELGYDRAWLCQILHGQARVLASGATSDLQRRQLLARHVTNLANAVVTAGREIRWELGQPANPVHELCRALADEGAARRITAFPLRNRAEEESCDAIVILEQFTASAREDEAAKRTALEPHAAQAFANALSRQRLSWGARLWNSEGMTSRRRAVITAAILAGLAFLAFPVPFQIEVDGRLMPVNTRAVFAPVDGIVSVIPVQHGSAVASGATLLELRSPTLDAERERILGEISELKARLATLQVMRAQGRRPSGESPGDLSAQEEQVQLALNSAERQRELIERQFSQLRIHSPINGAVDRWDLVESLASRPVVRGQHLLDVLDVAGDWELELEIPDRSIASVIAARSGGASLPVTYVLRTDPHGEHRATLTSVDDRTQVSPQGQLVVHATAQLPADATVTRRAGASILARIECGRCTRAYSWFHELWNSLALWWL